MDTIRLVHYDIGDFPLGPSANCTCLAHFEGASLDLRQQSFRWYYHPGFSWPRTQGTCNFILGSISFELSRAGLPQIEFPMVGLAARSQGANAYRESRECFRRNAHVTLFRDSQPWLTQELVAAGLSGSPCCDHGGVALDPLCGGSGSLRKCGRPMSYHSSSGSIWFKQGLPARGMPNPCVFSHRGLA